MKFVFLTNQASYHQMHFARAMVSELGENNFRIVFEKGTSAARAEMGWKDDYIEPYIIRFSESEDARFEARQWIDQADVVIQGRFPIKHVRQRIKNGQLTFACQERLWKKPPSWKRIISRFVHIYKNYYSVNKPNYHFLAIGAFAAQDLNDLGVFVGRSWRYGYFIDCPEPPTNNNAKRLKLLWCARFSEVKQPAKAIEILKGLVDGGVEAELTMIGDGDLRADVEAQVQREELSDHVHFTGWQSQHDVFTFMREADLFLMTSHHGEGWGLVVNEALSHGCAVLANRQLGAAQWLVKDGVNGVLYSDEHLALAIQNLVELGVQGVRQLGANANRIMAQHWSASTAAKRTIGLAQKLINDDIDTAKTLYKSGVCSHL